jgi:hypothetical protein
MPRPSELFPAGSEALVYLVRGNRGGVSILQLLRMPDRGRIDAIRRFVKVEAALRAPEPAWSEALPPDGTLDDLTHWALVHVRPAGAAVPMRAMLARTLDRAEEGEHPEPEHLNRVASHLARPDGDPASLPLLERLARWILALPDREFRRHWPMCSPGALLARTPTEAVPDWVEVLGKLMRRSGANEHALQGTANALAFLPESAGVPALLQALEGRAWVVASALTNWARRNPEDRAGRAGVRERAQRLRTEAEAEGDATLTFRRHLDNLIEATTD